MIAWKPALADACTLGKFSRALSPPTCRFAQPTTFDQTINLKTATTLGLTIPLQVLARADKVTE